MVMIKCQLYNILGAIWVQVCCQPSLCGGIGDWYLGQMSADSS